MVGVVHELLYFCPCPCVCLVCCRKYSQTSYPLQSSPSAFRVNNPDVISTPGTPGRHQTLRDESDHTDPSFHSELDFVRIHPIMTDSPLQRRMVQSMIDIICPVFTRNVAPPPLSKLITMLHQPVRAAPKVQEFRKVKRRTVLSQQVVCTKDVSRDMNSRPYGNQALCPSCWRKIAFPENGDVQQSNVPTDPIDSFGNNKVVNGHAARPESLGNGCREAVLSSALPEGQTTICDPGVGFDSSNFPDNSERNLMAISSAKDTDFIRDASGMLGEKVKPQGTSHHRSLKDAAERPGIDITSATSASRNRPLQGSSLVGPSQIPMCPGPTRNPKIETPSKQIPSCTRPSSVSPKSTHPDGVVPEGDEHLTLKDDVLANVFCSSIPITSSPTTPMQKGLIRGLPSSLALIPNAMRKR